MIDERGTGGNVATILVEGRKATGINQSELAERAGVSRSAIIAAEQRSSLPTMEVCLKLAEALKVPLRTMVQAQARDAVFAADPKLFKALDAELWSGNSHWRAMADHHGLSIGQGSVLGRVSGNGNLSVVRRFAGCVATRVRKRIVFRDRIVGERPPFFAIKGTPRGLAYSMHVSIEGEWARHIVEFHRPWGEADGPIDFEIETFMPNAYVAQMEGDNKRRHTEGLPPHREWTGDFRYMTANAFERLKLALQLPTGYDPPWQEPTAAWGISPIEDSDYSTVDSKTCQSSHFKGEANRATLLVEKPVPGFTFGIRWTPLPWDTTAEGDEQ